MLPVTWRKQTLAAERGQVRKEWLDRTIRELQVAAGFVRGLDRAAVRVGLDARAAALPTPRGRLERMIARAILIEFACRFGQTFHARFHAGAVSNCPFRPLTHVEHLWAGGETDHVREAFQRWIRRFFDDLEDHHPPSVAERAAQLINEDMRRPWSLRTLAAAVGVSPFRLERVFVKQYGISPRVFLRGCRLASALSQLAAGAKVEAVALQVGYRSKKNFYHALRQSTGLTPAAVRRLPTDKLHELLWAAGFPDSGEGRTPAT
ncbi:MAG: helix-turn-helix transcriptional regulator [Acidobacteriota bacterium]|nr:helix-turn-helix transcriptional regulator [Acidobacteriota bacterium]